VYLKLVDQHRIEWQNRAQFFGVAAQLIRRILVDHARNRRTAKRGGRALTVTLDEAVSEPVRQDVDLVKLDDALLSLATKDEQQSRVVELRFFGGLSIEETAEVLRISPSTVKRDWAAAKAWLYRDMSTRISP
jgi:RNA polymerase sigma-70 factor (ECF subfamily)